MRRRERAGTASGRSREPRAGASPAAARATRSQPCRVSVPPPGTARRRHVAAAANPPRICNTFFFFLVGRGTRPNSISVPTFHTFSRLRAASASRKLRESGEGGGRKSELDLQHSPHLEGHGRGELRGARGIDR